MVRSTDTRSVSGEVILYNVKTKWGTVKTKEGKAEVFFCGWYASKGLPRREPKVGEKVQVVYFNNKLVSVRGE